MNLRPWVGWVLPTSKMKPSGHGDHVHHTVVVTALPRRIAPCPVPGCGSICFPFLGRALRICFDPDRFWGFLEIQKNVFFFRWTPWSRLWREDPPSVGPPRLVQRKIPLLDNPIDRSQTIGAVFFGTGWALTGARPTRRRVRLGLGVLDAWAIGGALFGWNVDTAAIFFHWASGAREGCGS